MQEAPSKEKVTDLMHKQDQIQSWTHHPHQPSRYPQRPRHQGRKLFDQRRQLDHLGDRIAPILPPALIIQQAVSGILQILRDAVSRPGQEIDAAFEGLAGVGVVGEFAAEEFDGGADGGLEGLHGFLGDEGFYGGAALAVDAVGDGTEGCGGGIFSVHDHVDWNV